MASFSLLNRESARADSTRAAKITRRRYPVGFITSSVILGAILLVAAFPHWFTSADPLGADLINSYAAPSKEHWFGTDQLGRDMFTRVVYGAQYSLVLGLAATAVGAVGGIVIGAIAGYARGTWDRVFTRFLDVLLAFPDVLLAIITITVLGMGQTNVIWAIGIGRIPGAARLVRSQVIQVRESGYVQSAVGLGLTRFQVVVKHVLPNSVGPLLVSSVIGVGLCIIFGAGLSFLGLGAQAPTPEWGLMLSEARQYLSIAPWIGIWPGVFLTITVIVITATGRWLQQRFINKRSSL